MDYTCEQVAKIIDTRFGSKVVALPCLHVEQVGVRIEPGDELLTLVPHVRLDGVLSVDRPRSVDT